MATAQVADSDDEEEEVDADFKPELRPDSESEDEDTFIDPEEVKKMKDDEELVDSLESKLVEMNQAHRVAVNEGRQEDAEWMHFQMKNYKDLIAETKEGLAKLFEDNDVENDGNMEVDGPYNKRKHGDAAAEAAAGLN